MEYKLHPLCTFFPRMNDKEFAALVSDIQSNGLNHPITMLDGMILDGGNRYKACIESGIEPVFAQYMGTDAVRFVLSENLERRHLDAGQRAAIVSSIADFTKTAKAGENQFTRSVIYNPPTSTNDRAKESGASKSTQKKADAVVKADPILGAQVARGEISLNKATKQVAPQLLNKPKSEPETIEPEYTELDQLRDDNSELRDRIVDLERLCQIAGIDTGITDDVLNDAKKQIKDLEANLKAVTTSRDFFMNENAQLKRQLKLNKKAA